MVPARSILRSQFPQNHRGHVGGTVVRSVKTRNTGPSANLAVTRGRELGLQTGVWMDLQGAPDVTSDESLVLLARAGDRAAFAELWERHARSGIRVARQFTSTLEAEDLVSEAYTRIYQAILGGGGPTGGFRPYLYTTIRNIASRWGGNNTDVQVDDFDSLEDDTIPEDPVAFALDRTLTVRAFRSLPERWQSVLWYTEVEGMDPHEVAPILGITANSVAALAYRAREGLRKAWLQAHISDDGESADCRWAIQRLGDKARHSLTDREQTRLHGHLATCSRCCILSEEVEEVGSRLALVLFPLMLGGVAGGTLLASMGAPSSATAAQLQALAMPPAFDPLTVASVSGPSVSGGLSAVSVLTAPILAGSVALAVAFGGGVATTMIPPAPPAQDVAVEEQPNAGSDAAPDGSVPFGGTDPGDPVIGKLNDVLTATDPDIGGTVSNLLDDVVTSVTDPINALLPNLPIGPIPDHAAPTGAASAVVDLDLFGKGMPGAVVSAQVAGQVYTTVVLQNGTWALKLTALPEGVGPITLKQNLKILGVTVPISIPLTLLSDTLGFTVQLLN